MVELKQIQPDCARCSLDGYVKVWGSGPDQADLVIVGEAPGINEEKQGKPFVGISGDLLRNVLRQAGIDESKVFFTNVCLCRPRRQEAKPSDNEVHCCSNRLRSEILLRKPKKILCLGSTASQALLGQRITTVRGTYLQWEGIDVLSTFHPASVLRNPGGFRNFAEDILKLIRGRQTWTKPSWEIVGSKYEALTLFDEACHAKLDTSLDIETSSYSPYIDRFLCCGIMNTAKNHAYILENDLLKLEPEAARGVEVMSKELCVVCHNGQFEYRWLKEKFGIKLKIGFDTMLAHHALDERSGDKGAAHDLKTLGGYYFDLPNWEHEFKKHVENDDYSTAPKEILYDYLALDLMTTLRLKPVFEEELKDDEVWEPFTNIIMPGLPALGEMSCRGLLVDWKYLCDYLETLFTDRIKLRAKRLEILLGKEPGWLNTRSHKKMSALFYDELGMPEMKGKGRSTGKKVIKELEQKTGNKMVKLIGNLRRLQAIKSSFCDRMQESIAYDGRIHAAYKQTGTDTGRLAGHDPNPQNIPNHFGYGKVIRDIFIASPGYELLEVDFKQLEFRWAAIITGDKTLIQYIQTKRDIHSEQASLYFNVPIEKVTKDHRHDAKRVVFGVFFRRGPHSVSREYDIPLKESIRRFQILFDTCPGILDYFKMTDDYIKEHGEVSSLYGRKRRFPLLLRDNVEEAGRQAVNHPIQSTATDHNFLSNLRITKHPQHGEDFHWLATIHDGDLFEIKTEVYDERAAYIKFEKEKDPPFDTKGVKFEIDMARGTRWGSMEPYTVKNND